MKREVIPYNSKLKDLARKLRKNMTISETILWEHLKGKQMLGYDFDRQRPINNYIVDFYCKDLKLAIEIDGSSHDTDEAKEHDQVRQQILENLGLAFLRFDDLDVRENIGEVLKEIESWIKAQPTPIPSREGSTRNINFPSSEGPGAGLNALLTIAKNAASAASIEILRIYKSGDFSIESKSDNSPLTLADQASHMAIVRELEKTNLPILSEEGKEIPYETRKNWEYFWMIDPLDGTKEFIKRNGEFTVNIALIQKKKPVLGVVMVPVTGDLYEACAGSGAFKNGQPIRVSSFSFKDKGLKVVASRSHLTPETQEFIDTLDHPEFLSKGSSLKLLMVAEGAADLYPRYAPTMEWDTAAAQIIVEEAGGHVLIKDTNRPVVYNKPDLLNPHFLVTAFPSSEG